MARPPMYQSDGEKPISVSLRIPKELYEQVQQKVHMRRMTLTEALLDGLRLWLVTPTDPRDILVSQDNTVMQEVQKMIRAAVQKEIGTLRDFLGPHASALGVLPTPEAPPASVPDISHDATTGVQDTVPAAPEAIEAQIDQHISRLEHRIHEIQHYDNNTVIQELLPEAAVTPQDDIQHYENTVLQEETAPVSDVGGTPGQTAVPPFDASKRYLGMLCPRGHNWGGSSQSLRNIKGSYCLTCNKEIQRAKRQQVGA